MKYIPRIFLLPLYIIAILIWVALMLLTMVMVLVIPPVLQDRIPAPVEWFERWAENILSFGA